MDQRHAADGRVPDPMRHAHEVVGLYGDPASTWGICVELAFSDSLDVERIRQRADQLVVDYPHLGSTPTVSRSVDVQWETTRAGLASTPFTAGAPLVRLAVDESCRRILIAAHHGVCDGLGLVAIADRLTERCITSKARGIGDRAASRHFLASSLRRLSEAALQPPARFFGTGAQESGGPEVLLTCRLDVQRKGTVELCHALVQVFAAWPSPGRRRRRPLFLMGASRRRAGVLEPDRQTAYLRFPLHPNWPVSRIREEFARLEPEPDFPETSAGGLGPFVTRLLRNRLGATALLSNLGVLEGNGLQSVAMFPAVSGPRAVAVGISTTSSTTTLTLRTRSQDFTRAEAQELLDRVGKRFVAVTRKDQ